MSPTYISRSVGQYYLRTVDLVYMMKSLPVIGCQVLVKSHIVRVSHMRRIGFLGTFPCLFVLLVHLMEMADVFLQKRDALL